MEQVHEVDSPRVFSPGGQWSCHTCEVAATRAAASRLEGVDELDICAACAELCEIVVEQQAEGHGSATRGGRRRQGKAACEGAGCEPRSQRGLRMRDADDEPQEEELEDGEEDAGEESDGEESDEDDDDGDDGAAEIASLREHLAATPGDYDSHLRLIALLKAAAELDGVRAAREALAATFPLPEDVWLAWVDDEERLADSADELRAVQRLCLRGCEDYLSVPLWLRATQLAARAVGVELDAAGGGDDPPAAEAAAAVVREAFEQALTAGGLHVAEGGALWDGLEAFERRQLRGAPPAPAPARARAAGRVAPSAAVGWRCRYSTPRRRGGGTPRGRRRRRRPTAAATAPPRSSSSSSSSSATPSRSATAHSASSKRSPRGEAGGGGARGRAHRPVVSKRWRRVSALGPVRGSRGDGGPVARALRPRAPARAAARRRRRRRHGALRCAQPAN